MKRFATLALGAALLPEVADVGLKGLYLEGGLHF